MSQGRPTQGERSQRAAASRSVRTGYAAVLAAGVAALAMVITTATPGGRTAAAPRVTDPGSEAVLAGATLAESTLAGGTEVEASTSPAGATVQIGFDGAYWEVGSPGGGGGPGGGGCARRWEPPGAGFSASHLSYLSLALGTPPSPEHLPFQVWCGDAFIDWAWILPSEFNAATGPSAAEIAAQIARDLPYPQITVGVNPAERGLAGLETWLWTEGYDGAPITDSVTGLGATVEVEARAVGARWDFGDGTGESVGSLTGSPGEPAARHVYERRSGPEGFTVVAAFSFAVRYRVDGGEWATLAPVSRSASRTYVVADAQAQLVTGPGR